MAYVWATRCIPAFSCIAMFALLILSFIVQPYGRRDRHAHRDGEATWPQLVLSYYTVFLHILSIAFPVRACWAMRDLMVKMRDSAVVSPSSKRRVLSVKSETGIIQYPVPLFVIILPAYKESMATLEETLRVLASHPRARHAYHVYLAMEEKEEKSAAKAAHLCSTFETLFHRMSYTIHPSNIPGEAQGKSSNESWAAKQVLVDYPDQRIREHVVVTVMDADTHLSSRYFAQITRLHCEHPATSHTTIYVPPLVFDRNLHHVPLPVRTADMMWAAAGLSSLHASSTVCIPTSVYSLPLALVEQVGGWDADPGAIGEDLHMYLKCFFALSGNLCVQIVYAAASQCNVSSDADGVYGYCAGLGARYKQALRHMWGSLDTGFAIRELVKMIQRHGQACQAQAELPLSAPNSNWTAFYTSTGLDKSLAPNAKDAKDVRDSHRPPPPAPVHLANVFTLFHRLFEAHFLPIHLAVILTTSSIYTLICPGFLVPTVLKLALDISGWCRLVGFLTMFYFFFLYERYHRLCVHLRQEEMRRAGMLEDMTDNDGFTLCIFQIAGLFETALFPLGGFIFGAIPALHAVVSHMFTDRLTYVVSLKPQLALREWRDVSRMTP